MRAMIEQIGIVGAGTMGNGIAQVCAAAGLPVVDDRHLRCRAHPRHVGGLRQPGAAGQQAEDDRCRPAGRAGAHHDETDTGKIFHLRSRDRGGDRERRSEDQDPEGSLRKAAAADDARHQHLLDLDHETRRGDRPAGPFHRHALLQSGAADGAAGIDPRPADLGRHPRQGGSLCKTGRQGRRSRRRTARALRSTASCAR